MIPWVVAAAVSAFGQPVRPCATLDLLPGAAPLRVSSAPGLRPPPSERDPYALPNAARGTRFVVRWGDQGGISDDEARRLLAAMERAWEVVVDTLGHPAPATTDTTLFNVYVGDTGGPSGYGAGGYYTVDDEGYPMVVVATSSIRFDPAFADHAGQHEFYHAVQDSTARYAYDGPAAWYWEATAEWAALEIDPTNPYDGPFVFAYLALPGLPVDTFDYPDTGALVEYFQYGSFLFPHALGQTYGFELVRDSWTVPGSEGDPLEVLRAGLAERGADLDEAWLDHLARNVGFDYDAGELFRATYDLWASWYPEQSRITAEVAGTGGSGELAPDALHRYGAANLLLAEPDPGTLEVRLVGADTGDLGSPARYGARVVRERRDGTTEVLAVPFDGAIGALRVPVEGDEAAIWVTVGAWTPERDPLRWTEEGFPLAWSLVVLPPEAPEPSAPRAIAAPEACGCDAVSSGAGGAVVGLLMVLARRRGNGRWRE